MQVRQTLRGYGPGTPAACCPADRPTAAIQAVPGMPTVVHFKNHSVQPLLAY